ncbi:hypothetical protein ColTof4_14339 [Colletotrichum tofieldiae]|nr:hypothetical protein ColTof3_14750 [Colletotrichum tofieldiae]GKT81916.1 hypothetical protein ColTof4_14339 [Colletotrichum tofieldiae]
MEHILPSSHETVRFPSHPRNTLDLLRKAARNWNLDPKNILFAVAFGPDWPSSIALLCALANPQRSQARQSKRTGVHISRSGITRQDVELAVASSRKTDPSDNPQEVKEPPQPAVIKPAIAQATFFFPRLTWPV